MAKRPTNSPEPSDVYVPYNVDAQEREMIGYATELARKQLIAGTASQQVILHFLKLGLKERDLQLENLRNQNLLLEAKKKQIDDERTSEQMFKDAMEAMRSYQGIFSEEVVEDD